MAVVLIKGDDPTLMSQALSEQITSLLGGGDRTLMVEEVTEVDYLGGASDMVIDPLIYAAGTPPFLTERRIVVGRHLGAFTRAEQVAPLIGWLQAPVPTTDLVLVWERPTASKSRMGTIPKKLMETLKSVGAIMIDAAPTGQGRKALIGSLLSEAPIRFDRATQKLITEHFGDDAGRVRPLIESLISSFGEGATVGLSDVEPYLGQASDVPPWELTDAIDAGDIALALDKLRRMTDGGDRHALAVMATLRRHYGQALALDGLGLDDRRAGEFLGGSPHMARKANALARRLGSPRLASIIGMLAQADLDLRGASAVPTEAIMEILVARLARISR